MFSRPRYRVAPGAPAAGASRARPRAGRRSALLLTFALVLGASLVGCTPTVLAPRPGTTATGSGNAAERDLQRTAAIVYHRMALGYLETGRYTTNVLVDVSLPQGVRWTLLAYPQDGSSYTLEVTSDALPGSAYEVSPDGVRNLARP